ncbi:MAG TPA: hypothetical protein VFY67_10850 [Pyrinomonadaceae bacterium]|nr:hypothetical protein [Pyrinomonadaceae bacterium]
MATKKQSFEQPKDNASAASKSAQGRKPGDSTSPGQSTPANQGQSNQSTQPNQGATGQNTGQNMGAGQNATTGQNTPQSGTAQGATGQGGQGGQGPVGQGAGQRGSTQGGQKTGGDQDLLQHAKEATGEIVSQVQQQAGSQIALQKDNAATDLTQVVQAVRRFGESLGQEQGGPIARYAAEYGDKAADSLERLSTYIREKDPKQLLNDVQNFGRRQPAILLGGAFLLGLAGARLIKSSMSMNAQSYRADVRRPSPNPNAL